MALHGSWLGITLTSLLQPGTSHLPKHRKDRGRKYIFLFCHNDNVHFFVGTNGRVAGSYHMMFDQKTAQDAANDWSTFSPLEELSKRCPVLLLPEVSPGSKLH